MKQSLVIALRRFLVCGTVTLLALGLTGTVGAAPSEPFEVDAYRDVTYYDGTAADAERHKLDLFLPHGQKDYPVLVVFHGGAWTIGDKSFYGLYSAVGRFLAGQGIGVALPNYRLSPGVKHPEHVRDAARAFRWVHDNIGKYGGRADRMFVAGHSAGAHLAALLATDERYLKAEGLSLADVRGVIPISGMYRIPEADLQLGAAMKLRLDGVGVLPDLDLKLKLKMPASQAMMTEQRVSLSPFSLVFGDDPKVLAAASPINHVRPGLPPFLVLYAEKELPTLARQAEDFAKALEDKQCDVTLKKIKDRSHFTILFRATKPEDTVARAIVVFVEKHAR